MGFLDRLLRRPPRLYIAHDSGEGPGGDRPVVVLVHGLASSSVTFDNLVPLLEPDYRCIAIDLIGMGNSEKLDSSGPERYTFEEHRRYFDAALAALNVEANVVLVVHDWGSALGFDWANRHREAIKGLCYMESLVRPVSWTEWILQAYSARYPPEDNPIDIRRRRNRRGCCRI